MNMVFLGIGVLVVVLVIVVVIVLISDSGSSSKQSSNKSKSNSNTNRVDSSAKITISSIEFPKNIEQMPLTALSQITKNMFDTYNALAYCNKSGNALEKTEWHSWQVSMLLVFLKLRQDFLIPYEKNIFHSSILDLSEEVRQNEMQKIFRKYTNNVNVKKSRDSLSGEVIWSAREVSIILYAIMFNKKF